jgi:hypothetical protein
MKQVVRKYRIRYPVISTALNICDKAATDPNRPLKSL